MKQQIQTNKIEWKEVEIGELLDYEQPGKYIVEREILKEKTKSSIPVLTANKSFILGYTEEKDGIYKKYPVIIFDDFTTDTKFVDFKFKVKSSAMKLLRPKSKDINLKFVFLMMKGIQLNFATHKRYYLSVYQHRNILMPFLNGRPDIKEQERIVKILEDSLDLNDKGEKVENLFNEYLKSVFYEMFYNKGFEEKSLSEICSFIDYRGKTPKKTKEGIPLITAKNVKIGFLSDEPREFISEKDYAGWMTRGFPQKGDILFTTEAPLGNVARLGKFNKIALAQRIITLHCGKKIDSYYLMYILLSPKITQKIETYSTGSTVRGIRAKQFKKIKIPLPPFPLQQKFAKIVEQVEKMKKNINKTKQNSEELFNSLISKAFRGEL